MPRQYDSVKRKTIMYENDWEIFVRFVHNLISPREGMQMASMSYQIKGSSSFRVPECTSLKKKNRKEKKNVTKPGQMNVKT